MTKLCRLFNPLANELCIFQQKLLIIDVKFENLNLETMCKQHQSFLKLIKKIS